MIPAKVTTPRCKLCKQKLTNEESIARGIGPECAAKYAWMLCDAGLTIESLQISQSLSTDPNVARWLGKAEAALLAGNRRDVEQFKSAAQRAAERLALTTV